MQVQENGMKYWGFFYWKVQELLFYLPDYQEKLYNGDILAAEIIAVFNKRLLRNQISTSLRSYDNLETSRTRLGCIRAGGGGEVKSRQRQ